jgi:phage head maturation protease
MSNLQDKKSLQYAVKSATATIMDVDMSKRVVTGLFNSYNYFDSGYDVLLKGCAAKSIAERGPQSTAVQKIKHLIDHSWSKLPGKIQVLEEKNVNGIDGIYFETKMAPTTLGNDTLINYQEKVYDNHSIGFRYLDGKYIKADAAEWDMYVSMLLNPQAAKDAGFMYVWKEIKLYEGSTVAFGENSLTPYLGVKSQSKEGLAMKVNERIDLLTKQLTSGAQSDESMHLFEMEALQLKQIVNELFNIEPSVKDTLQSRPNTDAVKGVDFGILSNIFKSN